MACIYGIKESCDDCRMYFSQNNSNISQALNGLDAFTKNWCINHEETEKENELVFRCKECPFLVKNQKCIVKVFASEHGADMNEFGSMAR